MKHSEKCWVISTQIWVKKNVELKVKVEVGFYTFIFNPTFGFVHVLPKIWLKQPSIV